jgi:hypothetical protein
MTSLPKCFFPEKQPVEPVSKRSILSKVKEDDDFNHRNILDISRIKI